MESQLTYEWLTPILLGIVGTMGMYYLHSMNEKVKDIDAKVTKHIEKVEVSMNATYERYFKVESRVTRLEDHIIAK